MPRRGRSRFDETGAMFFVTTTLKNFDPIFALGDCYYRILLDSLQHVLIEYQATLYAYVFMPSHVHMVIRTTKGRSISGLMRDFKKFTSTRIRQQLERDGQVEIIEQLRRNATPKKNRVFQVWMDRFDDVLIYSEKVMAVKVRYIHNNPVKADLVGRPEDWPYSSARNYLRRNDILLPVEMDWFGSPRTHSTSSHTDPSGRKT